MGYVVPSLPRKYELSYELCKRHQRSTDFSECESCKDRFVCWTQRKPDNVTIKRNDILGIYTTKQAYCIK